MPEVCSTLKEILYRHGNIAIAPGCYDAIGARLIEEAGFPLAYMSGLAVAASLGYADIGIIGLTEMVKRAQVIAGSIDIPLLADADTGYGGPSNIARTVREFERAGVAGIHLEDQSNPKRCAALPGKDLVSIAEMTARIQVAVAARKNPDFMIIGRTDAFPYEGLEASIARARAYEEAGADATMIMLVNQIPDMRTVVTSLHKPTLVLMSEKLNPLIGRETLQEIGFPVVVYPLSTIKSAVHAQENILKSLNSNGTTGQVLDQLVSINQLHELMDTQEAIVKEQVFSAMSNTRCA